MLLWVSKLLGLLLAWTSQSLGFKVKISLAEASEMSEPNIRNRIIGGESVRPHAMPWQAAVVKKGKSRPNCGATIICPQFVIGAAHCRAKYIDRPHLLEILIGAHSWPVESTTTRKNIKKIHKYRRPYNNATQDNDFILYEVDSPIQFNDKARPVFLPGRKDQGSATYVASGWGCLRRRVAGKTCKLSSVPDHADQLQAVRLQHVPKEDCQKAWSDRKGRKITARMLCAGEMPENKKSPGYGDSGGPLTRLDHQTDRIILRGITSFGFPMHPSVFSDLSNIHIDRWIDSVTDGCNGKTCIIRKECMKGQELDEMTRTTFYE